MWTIDRLIAAIGSVGAFTAAVATLFVVLEMARQRRASYRPELIATDSQFVIKKKEYGFGSHVWEAVDAAYARSMRSGGRWIEVAVSNVGMAPAKRIRMKGECNFKKAIKVLNKLSKEAGVADRWELRSKHIICQEKGFNAEVFMESPAAYILPATVARDATFMVMPWTWQEIVWATMDIYLADEKKRVACNQEELQECLPEADVLLEYQDVSGKRHVNKMKLKILVYEFLLDQIKVGIIFFDI